YSCTEVTSIPCSRRICVVYPQDEPQNGSQTIFRLAFLIAGISTSSASRLRYVGLTSICSYFVSLGFGLRSASAGSAAMIASIWLVVSGSAGAPSGVENLIPLYSGG